MARLQRGNGSPFHVLILGTGMVGKHAVEAATKLGNIERNARQIERNGPGSIALSIGRNLTKIARLWKLCCGRRMCWSTRHNVVIPASRSFPMPGWPGYRSTRLSSIWLSIPICWNTCRQLSEDRKGYPKAIWTNMCSCQTTWNGIKPCQPPFHQSIAGLRSPAIHGPVFIQQPVWIIMPPDDAINGGMLNKGYHGLSLDGGYFERALYRARLPEPE